jgi:hypothetical protein
MGQYGITWVVLVGQEKPREMSGLANLRMVADDLSIVISGTKKEHEVAAAECPFIG